MSVIVNAEYEELGDDNGELDLNAEISLPWLESEEDDNEAGALDTRQMIAFGAILLAALGVLVGLVWYLSNAMGAPASAPDGSIIAAPSGPYKERPQDPGGKEFAGTGNVAPLVAEGGAPQAVVASTAKPAAPDVPADKPAPAGTSDAAASAAPVASGVGVQLAAYGSRERAERGWADLSRRSESLQGVRHRVVEGVVDIGTVYRLQAVTADRASADQLCAALKREGLDCQVKP
ncbi:MAG: SPOR domain-containing protein [Erythrobacter sp.]